MALSERFHWVVKSPNESRSFCRRLESSRELIDLAILVSSAKRYTLEWCIYVVGNVIDIHNEK